MDYRIITIVSLLTVLPVGAQEKKSVIKRLEYSFAFAAARLSGRVRRTDNRTDKERYGLRVRLYRQGDSGPCGG